MKRILYHFTRLEYALSSIAFRRMKMSLLDELNDPFEMCAVDMSDPWHKEAIEKNKAELSSKYGVVCFCGNWSNPLMWGHYADSHAGVALGFEVSDEVLIKVDYTEKRVKLSFNPITKKIENPDAIQLIIGTKYIDWKYEDEHRFYSNLSDETCESGRYFAEFSERLILREVILGYRCMLPMSKMKALTNSLQSPVEVSKATMSLSDFEMVVGSHE